MDSKLPTILHAKIDRLIKARRVALQCKWDARNLYEKSWAEYRQAKRVYVQACTGVAEIYHAQETLLRKYRYIRTRSLPKRRGKKYASARQNLRHEIRSARIRYEVVRNVLQEAEADRVAAKRALIEARDARNRACELLSEARRVCRAALCELYACLEENAYALATQVELHNLPDYIDVVYRQQEDGDGEYHIFGWTDEIPFEQHGHYIIVNPYTAPRLRYDRGPGEPHGPQNHINARAS